MLYEDIIQEPVTSGQDVLILILLEYALWVGESYFVVK